MEGVPDSSRFPIDCLPLEGDYFSRETLYAVINDWAASRGYAFMTGRSRKTSNGRLQVIFNNNRSAGHTLGTLVIRQWLTVIKHIGCQFSIIAKERLSKASWKLTH